MGKIALTQPRGEEVVEFGVEAKGSGWHNGITWA
jgi:hypothetical protein